MNLVPLDILDGNITQNEILTAIFLVVLVILIIFAVRLANGRDAGL